MTEGRDITPWFALRFYYYRVFRWGCVFLLIALAVKHFTPPEITIPLRSSMLAMLVILFIGLVFLSVRAFPFVVKTLDGLAQKNLGEKGLACNSARPFQPSPKATVGRGEAGQAASLTCCNAAMSNGRSA